MSSPSGRPFSIVPSDEYNRNLAESPPATHGERGRPIRVSRPSEVSWQSRLSTDSFGAKQLSKTRHDGWHGFEDTKKRMLRVKGVRRATPTPWQWQPPHTLKQGPLARMGDPGLLLKMGHESKAFEKMQQEFAEAQGAFVASPGELPISEVRKKKSSRSEADKKNSSRSEADKKNSHPPKSSRAYSSGLDFLPPEHLTQSRSNRITGCTTHGNASQQLKRDHSEAPLREESGHGSPVSKASQLMLPSDPTGGGLLTFEGPRKAKRNKIVSMRDAEVQAELREEPNKYAQHDHEEPKASMRDAEVQVEPGKEPNGYVSFEVPKLTIYASGSDFLPPLFTDEEYRSTLIPGRTTLNEGHVAYNTSESESKNSGTCCYREPVRGTALGSKSRSPKTTRSSERVKVKEKQNCGPFCCF